MRRLRQGGFSLIEVLVAVVVLAIGLIGAAAMQFAAMRTRHQSALLSNGVQLASSLAERMRANRTQMRLADSANPYLQLRYEAEGGTPPAPPAMCFDGAACSSEALAQFDLFEVAAALHAQFPAARISVCRAAEALSWDCGGGPASPIVIKLGWRIAPADAQFAPSVALVLPQVAP